MPAQVVISVCKIIDACMPQCLLHAVQLKRACDAAKPGEFIGEFSWVKFDPMGVKGLIQCKQMINYQ